MRTSYRLFHATDAIRLALETIDKTMTSVISK